MVWFPALWPETYSYTLSACLLGGWPVVAPDIGAFAERLQGRRWTWVQPWDTPAADWLAFFTDIRQRHFATGQSPAPVFTIVPTDGHVPPAVASHDWYRSDYLQQLPSAGASATLPDRATLAAHLPGPGEGTLAAAGGGGPLVAALASLRSLPVLSGVARAVPAHWQRRVKNWLQR